ncbi:hypothetical protein DSLASN_18430 [Desulfoluna limicola]|uniref:Uncharacterized protein n=1 Tax=Desulfoluna limicola TaxID=2810562 RepID=A0ABM7PGK6_9BACT|nr:hypothetical protein [Desulfoluna limicola]BCS96211.1 hypothetical protein DSLASN_18430 [Desulfoluna limicola]
MKLKISIFICVIFASLNSSYSIADTIRLNSGRTITSNKTWTKNGRVYCFLDGVSVSFDLKDVAYVKKSNPTKFTKNGFKFDIWKSGIDIYEILTIARNNNIPLHRDGLISTNKNFNPKVCRKYANSATKYYYNTKLLGQYCKVELFLTPKSKLLHSLSIRWNNTGSKDKLELEKEVKNIIMKKYGGPKKLSTEVFGKTYHWSPKPHINIESSFSASGGVLLYKDTKIQRIGEQEKAIKKNQIKAQYQKSDISKF